MSPHFVHWGGEVLGALCPLPTGGNPAAGRVIAVKTVGGLLARVECASTECDFTEIDVYVAGGEIGRFTDNLPSNLDQATPDDMGKLTQQLEARFSPKAEREFFRRLGRAVFDPDDEE